MPIDFAKIKEFREKKDLTQEEAGKAAKLGGRRGWSLIETGRRKNLTIDTLERIATVLGVTAKDLLK